MCQIAAHYYCILYFFLRKHPFLLNVSLRRYVSDICPLLLYSLLFSENIFYNECLIKMVCVRYPNCRLLLCSSGLLSSTVLLRLPLFRWTFASGSVVYVSKLHTFTLWLFSSSPITNFCTLLIISQGAFSLGGFTPCCLFTSFSHNAKQQIKTLLDKKCARYKWKPTKER